MALGGCLGLFVLFGAVVAGSFFLQAKWSPKTYLPRQLGGEPAKARDVAERLQAGGLKCCWVPHGEGRVAVAVGVEDNRKNSAELSSELDLFERHAREGAGPLLQLEGSYSLVYISEYSSPQAAADAARIVGWDAFTWGRFLIYGHKNAVEAVRKAL